MFKNTSRSRSVLSKTERIGILYLIGFVLALILIKELPSQSGEEANKMDPARMEALRCQLEDLAYQDSLARLPKIYPFNPNFMTDAKGYQFGMTMTERDRLKQFRARGKWIRSAAQFKAVTGVSDSVLMGMQPYFKFPVWTQSAKAGKPRIRLDKTVKIDINNASKEALMAVYGVGEVFADRLLAYTKENGPFPNNRSLYEVYGVRPEAIDSLLLYFEVKDPKPALKLDALRATASDLATIPGVDFDLAKRMWEFVRLRGGLVDLQEFLKIEGMTVNKLRRIELYLKVEIR